VKGLFWTENFSLRWHTCTCPTRQWRDNMSLSDNMIYKYWAKSIGRLCHPAWMLHSNPVEKLLTGL